MIESSSRHPEGRRQERRDIGHLPNGAVTEWLEAEASADEIIYEDAVGNVATEETDPKHIQVHIYKSKYKTNMAWAKAEIVIHNKLHPLNPWIIRRSYKRPEYICICNANSGEHQ